MKGISPLIAAVLLIAFTVAVGGIVSVFFTGFTKQTTSGVSSQGQNLVTCAGSNPAVDKVYYPITSSYSNITVTYSNPGTYNITNVTIYVALPNGTTISLGNQMYLNGLASNSSVLGNGTTVGTQPTEVKVAGFCQATQPVSGSCTSGQTCMVGQ